MAQVTSVIPAQPVGPRFSAAIRNVISNWAAFLVTSLVSFFLSPFIVRQLGDASYGAWVLIGSITGYLGLLDLGVRGAVTRYTASFSSRDDHAGASGVVSTALAIFLAGGVLAIGVAAILAFTVLHKFQISPGDLGTARLVLMVVGFNVAVSLVSGVFGGVITGVQRFDLANGIEIAAAVMRAVVIVVALSAGFGLLALALVHAGFALAIGAAYAACAMYVYPQLQVGLRWASATQFRLIFSFSLFSFVLHVSTYLIYYTDSLVIGAFLPISMVTFFAIAGNLIHYARALVSGISTTMTPMISALQAREQMEEMNRVLLRAFKYATLLILAVGITFLLRGATFIGLWMGPEYANPSGHVLWILTLALLPVASSQVAMSAMLGLNRHRAVVPVVVGEALANLALSIWWVRSMGINGVAWATAAPSLVISLFWWPWYVRRVTGIPLIRFLVSTWLRPAVAMVPFALVTMLAEWFWPAETLFMFFVQLGILLAVAGTGVWFVGLESKDREQLRGRLLAPALAWVRGR
ncbi:MAG: polysaccharide biosynthesis C-terminal domain-containing protein [Candidatus Acidiferrales bacterium]